MAREIVSRTPISDIEALARITQSLARTQGAQGTAGPTLYGPNGSLITPEMRAAFDDPSRYPSPGIPLLPAERVGSPARRFNVKAGYNLSITPRGESDFTPFDSLRAMASTCDLLRLAIQDVKNEIIGNDWDIVPDDESQSEEMKAEIAACKARVDKPDGQRTMRNWLSLMLDEILITDALSVAWRRDMKGDPHSLVIIDGATIKPLIDMNGLSPEPPSPAYYQIIMGQVKTWFTRPIYDATPMPEGQDKAELVYAPRNPQSWTPYGISPVEFVIIAANLALRRQLHYLAFYTAGSIPDTFYKVPMTWGPEQIKEMQTYLDELLSGDSEERRKVRVMPGGEGTGTDNPKGHEEWKYDFDEWLGRIVCWAFNTSNLPISRMLNRAVSEQADVAESDSGIKPLKIFIADGITDAIKNFYGYARLRFAWVGEKTVDQEFEARRAENFVKTGLYTMDDVIVPLGKEPTKIPRFIMGASGPIFFDDLLSLSRDERLALLRGGAAPVPEEEEPGEPGSPAPPPGKPTPTKEEEEGEEEVSEAALADLKRWRSKAMKAMRAGRPAPGFVSEAIPEGIHAALAEWTRHAADPEDLMWGFRCLPKADRPVVAARKRIRLERKMRGILKKHFKIYAPILASVVKDRFSGRLEQEEKAEDEGKYPTYAEIKALLNFDALADEMGEPLAEAFLEGGEGAGKVAGAEYGLTDEQAQEYAKQRGAELVGKRVLPDGTVIDNPNPRWSVPQSVRDTIRGQIDRALAEGWTAEKLNRAIEGVEGIWDWRSDMIARTETAFALNAGTAQVYEDNGVDKVIIHDGPGCLADGHDDGQPGVNGEVWTLRKWQEFPLGHPHCRRDASPVVE